jgi:putative tricarboxylic transport membrane protein
MKNKNYREDIIPGIVIMVFSALYLAFVPTIQPFVGLGATPLTNRFIPILWGTVLFILGAWIFVRGFRRKAAYLKDGGKPIKGKNFFKENREVVWSFVALAIYVALLQPVGFLISTILYTTAQILILTHMSKWKKTWLPALITGIVCGILLDYLFKQQLNVLLPQGILGW